MRATKSSKYSLTPLNVRKMRTDRIERVGEADVGLPCQGKIEGIGNPRSSPRAGQCGEASNHRLG